MQISQSSRLSSWCCSAFLWAMILYPAPGPAQAQQNVQYDDSPPPVGDQVPCMLTNKQNYTARSLLAPGQPAAAAVAQVVSRRANAIEATSPVSTAQKEALYQLAQSLYEEKYRNLGMAGIQRELPQLERQAVTTAIQETPAVTQPGFTTAQIKAAVQAEIRDTAQAAVSQVGTAFERPRDVSCSMSILPWDETHKAFGRTVADAFLAVQVTVRNLDGNNEFLIQDAELAVDANSAQLARFQVSHEKEIARGVLQYGQSYDRQHIFINIAEGVGTILGAVVGLPAPSIDNLTRATGAYHAGLMPTLHTIFPDLTTRNLNTLNDLAFSASSASRIVVPKNGSVPFVVFIPIKPLEQACWLQEGYNFFKDAGLDSACKQVCANDNCTNENLTSVRFKHWSPVQLQALQKHAYTLIAGAHFKLTGQGATLKSIVCASATDSSGAYLQYALPASGLSCALTGTDLDSMTVLRFRSPDDPKSNVDMKVTVSGDNTVANATLAAADAAKIQQSTYALYAVDKSGTEHDLNRTLSFRLPPTIAAGQSVPATGNANLTGTNLAGCSQVVFYDSADKTEVAKTNVISAAPTAITFTVPAALVAGTQYTVRLVLSDGSNTLFDTKTTVKRQ